MLGGGLEAFSVPHMKTHLILTGELLFLAALSASAQSTAFTYQGHLMDGGASANGNYDIQFTLKNALTAGATVGTPQAVSPVAAANGIFTVTLDFGSAPFDGSDRWVELGVRPAGSSDPYTVLVPRQRLTATPYALRALSATSFTGNISPAQIPAGTITGPMIAPGATITTSTAAPAASVANSGDNSAALSLSTSFRTWWVGQNKAPDATTTTYDQFFIYDQTANATRLRIDTTGVIYGNGAGLTGVAASTVGGVSAADIANGANLANAATTASTPNTLVKRDGSGNIPGVTPASTVPPGMVLIPAGAFTMGNSVAADADITNAAPVSTTVSAFYMDVTEVTLSQWQSVYYWATSNGYTFAAGAGKGPNHPVQTVTWYDVVKWCNARSEQAGKVPVYYTGDAQTTIYKTGNVNVTNAQVKWTANGYRLPTEAEWEKAARGGRNGQRFPWGNTITQNLANYSGNTASLSYDLGPNGYNAIGSIGGTTPATSPVGTFAANGYGLSDMAGNVLEWCWDWYGTPYAGGTDPHGATTGSGRVLRGGDWFYNADNARCAYRSNLIPDVAGYLIGFRAVLAPGQ